MTWLSLRALGCTVPFGLGVVAACGTSPPDEPGPGGAGGFGGADTLLGGSGGGSDQSTPEGFEVQAHLASDEQGTAPTTVGIVSWSLAGEAPEAAHIEFGLGEDYGMVAPVDLDQPEFRTLLLGMKPERTYHFRVVAEVDGRLVRSADQLLDTGAATDLVSLETVAALNAGKSERGFILSSFWRGESSTMAFIVDTDGDIVWWFDTELEDGVAQASMSADGASMWMTTASNTAAPLVRVSMDGLVQETYEETRGSHAIAPVIGDVMAYVDYGETDCDSLFEIDNAGTVVEIAELSDPSYVGIADDGGNSINCHGNSVAYNEARDLYAFSSYGEDVFILPRSGGLPTKLSEIVPGGNESWGAVQHGAQVLANSVLVFANKTSQNRSSYFEFSLLDGSILDSYDPGVFSANLGDVQRLPGGNTLVTFSNAGVVHEITPSGELVFELEAGGDQRMGYSSWRASLYGLPAETQQN